MYKVKHLAVRTGISVNGAQHLRRMRDRFLVHAFSFQTLQRRFMCLSGCCWEVAPFIEVAPNDAGCYANFSRGVLGFVRGRTLADGRARLPRLPAPCLRAASKYNLLPRNDSLRLTVSSQDGYGGLVDERLSHVEDPAIGFLHQIGSRMAAADPLHEVLRAEPGIFLPFPNNKPVRQCGQIRRGFKSYA